MWYAIVYGDYTYIEYDRIHVGIIIIVMMIIIIVIKIVGELYGLLAKTKFFFFIEFSIYLFFNH